MRGALLVALSVLAVPASGTDAADVEVVSPRAEAVSVTIYRDLFALITETRTVDLPAGPVMLSFDGVVETLLPQSAVVSELGRSLEERNYDYDQLMPISLLGKSIGKTVTLTRTLPGRGQVTHTRAVIVAANYGGITLRTEKGNEALHCSGIPEQLTFDELPAGLHPKPRLSIRLAAGPPGKRTIHVSYLAKGFSWESDYVAHLTSGDRMDLKGWVTLRNFTNVNLRAAQVQMVAGRLHLLGEAEGGTSVYGDTDYFKGDAQRDARQNALEMMQAALDDNGSGLSLFSGCYAVERPEERMFRRSIADQDVGIALEQVIVSGLRRIAEREELGDYHLYRLPWPTDLNARQTKQALFLDKARIKTERFYGFRFAAQDFEPDEEHVRLWARLSFENKKSSGLGEPLPGGMLRVFERGDKSDLFLGESTIDDAAIGTPVELGIGGALDLQLQVAVDSDTEKNRAGHETAGIADVDLHVLSVKPRPVTIEIRQELNEYSANAKIEKSNQRVGRKSGDFVWRFVVPANGAGNLTYRLRVPEPDD